MARNQIIGRVIAVSPITEVPSKEQGKPAIKKRELYMDCTTYDPYTGERSQYENKPLLEFGGDKLVDKLGALNLEAGDVVSVSFFIQGTPYKDQQTGKTKVFTAIRTTDIEVVRKRGEVAAPQQPAPKPEPQPAPAPQAAPQQTSQDGKDGLPF
ncbi:MAG: DUF3127 domain-containing protein [Alistipes sp.]|nr:DUF3127 domain-containing protein [Alistipes sp.]